METIAQGAEALLTKESGILTKERIKKSYRIAQIDEKLREKRTRMEARLLREARRAGILAPQILEEGKFTIKMEFIDGIRMKDFLAESNCVKMAEEIGKIAVVLHNYDIIHGDLTTSNMIARQKNCIQEIFLFDFGLGFFSQRAEDKATDLHLLKEAIESTHYGFADIMWKKILDAYKTNYSGAEKVIKMLSKIEKRGRYRERISSLRSYSP